MSMLYSNFDDVELQLFEQFFYLIKKISCLKTLVISLYIQ